MLALLGIFLFALFAALGVWQLQRLQWKLDLIERVDARVHAAAVPVPGPEAWPAINADQHEYLHVRVHGDYIGDAQVLVRGSARFHGRGFWVMTPLQTRRGFIVYINRGFVASTESGGPTTAVPAPRGQVSVTGLLRMTEPDGRFLRANDPEQGRWYSRDVVSMAAQAGLPATSVAPYFVDAGESATPRQPPIGGLTVVHFRNAHLPYALTWFALAGLVLVAAFIVARYERRRRQDHATRKRNGIGP